jgi:catechol 2,3-dioxygenase-like lactoylglutathione lyase family enzyme
LRAREDPIIRVRSTDVKPQSIRPATQGYNKLMKLDHATIVTPELEAVRHFFCHVVGLADGERPPFSFEGHWLYQDGKPVIHLVKARSQRPPARSSSRIDHIAFRLSDAEWTALTERLRTHRIDFQESEVPATGERQLFVTPAPEVTIEFVTSPRSRS